MQKFDKILKNAKHFTMNNKQYMVYNSNRIVIHCKKVLFQELLYGFNNNLEKSYNAWNLEHNAEKLQEILKRIMQRIMGIITAPLFFMAMG